MIKGRVDEVQALYDKCDNITKISNLLFIINVFLSFILLFSFNGKEIIINISLILIIIYVTLVNINDLYFSNLAENERRKSLIKESFGVKTTLKETKKYYNNNEKLSVKKFGLNCYESVWFTKNVVDKMLPFSIFKICVLAIIYIVLMINLENLNVLLVITQTLFSSEVIFSFIKLCYYKFQLEKINSEFEKIFFVSGANNENRDVLILDAVMDYECLKSYCKISISSKIFFNNNEKWSKEWKKLLKKIN